MRYFFLVLLFSSLALAVAAEPDYDAEARAAWAWAMKPVEAPKKAPPRVVVVRQVQVDSGPIHSHGCPKCGYVWSHGASSRGNLAAHTCPRCNTVLPHPWYPLR